MASVHPAEVQKRLGTIRGQLPLRGPKNTLSVCMIVKNEERNIERAIRSFLPFADEIIVNDTGSTDRTVEILKAFPQVRVIHSEWKKDFSYSRNLSLAEARCAWILWMDADDIVPQDQIENFRKLKTAPLDRAFGFQVINTQNGLPIGARFLQIRMFPNHPEIRFERRIHEQIIFSLAKLGLHVFYTEAIVWHTGYEKEGDNKAKSSRNLEILLQEPDRGIDPVISAQIGDAYAILERWGEAIDAYREVLSIPHSAEINVDAFKTAVFMIGKCYLNQGDLRNAQEWLQKAIAENPGRLDPVFHLGECFLRLGDKEKAWSYFQQCLTIPRTHSSQASHYEVMRMYAYKYLCDLAVMRQNPAEALSIAEQFLKEFPMVLEAPFYVGKGHLAMGNHAQAIYYLEKGLSAAPTLSRDAWYALILAYEKSGNQSKMGEARRRMAEAFGDRIPTHDKEIPLSVVMIVKNEQKHLPVCLSSLKDLADDLVIVDTGSADDTVKIAQSFGARVVHFPWPNDFSVARNRSLEEARGKWILWLDADDVLLDEDRRAIRSLVERREPNCAFSFLIKNSQDGGITGPVFNQIRLFPNRADIRFEGKVHEQVMPSLQRLGIPVEFLSIKVIHTGYTDPETVRQKQRRNRLLMEQDIAQNPQTVNAMKFFALGNACLDLGEYAAAQQWYRRAMERAEQAGEDRHILEICPVKIAECRAQSGDLSAAAEMLEMYLRQYPAQPVALYLYAQIQQKLGLEEQAARICGKLLHFQEQPTMIPVDYQQIKIKACKMLAQYWNARGHSHLAVEILKMGLAIGKGQFVAGSKLAALYFDLEEYHWAAESLEMAWILEKTPDILLALAKAQIMANHLSRAVELLELGERLYPENAEIKNLRHELRIDAGI